MKIAVIGSLTRDNITIKKRNEEYDQPGGGVYYSSIALATLGASVLAVPLLAQRDIELLACLDNPNIEIFPQWTNATTVYQNTYPSESLDVCEKKILSCAKNYELSDTLIEKIQKLDAVHLVPLSSNEFMTRSFKKFRNYFRGKICLDGQGFTKWVLPDLAAILHNNVDIIKIDEAEALQLTSKNSESDAVHEFLRWGLTEILITKASKGSSIYSANSTYDISPHKPSQIVDATGCGDSYMAGYLIKRLAGSSMKEAANFASQIGARAVEVKGALLPCHGANG